MGFIADHLDDGDSHVAANAKADEEANGAEEGNGVPFGHVRLAGTVGLHQLLPAFGSGALVELVAGRRLVLFPLIVA